MTVHPRHVTCVLGAWKSLDTVERLLPDGFTLDREYSQLEPDPRMPRAFAASADRVDPSMTPQDLRAIEHHRAVAYVLSPPLPAADARSLSARMLATIDALLANRATLAVKNESAGIAHGAARWRELAARARSTDELEHANALRLAFVRRPIASDEHTLYTCGMHLLGERDLEIASSGNAYDDIEWLDLLAIYLLAETPARGVADGEGFRQREGGPRRVLRATDCTRYESDDFFFNPYGYWRMDAP